MRKTSLLLFLIALCIPLSATSSPQATQPDLEILSFDLQPNVLREAWEFPASPNNMNIQSPRMVKGYLRSHLTVRNLSTKTAYLIDWEYALSDPNTEKEVARYHFLVKKRVEPNQKVTLLSVIDEARDTEQNRKVAEKYKRNHFLERAVLTAVEYVDGTSWRLPNLESRNENPRNAPAFKETKRSAPELKMGEKAPETAQPAPLSTPQEIQENDVLSINTRLVTVPIIATDSTGAYVTDLKADDFKVYEDEVEQRVSAFARVEAPFFVVLLLDTSGSMQWQPLEKAKRAATAFVDQLSPSTYVYAVTFDEILHPLHQSATNDHKVLREAIMSARSGGSTSLLDAVLAINSNLLNRVKGRKALILFTDGGENSSVGATRKNTIYDTEESDALIYVVHYYPSLEADYLKKLTESTGGRLYHASSEEDLRQAFTSLALELGRQYAISYYPNAPAVSGQTHNVRVVVTRPGVRVKSRKTYKVR